MIELQTTDNNCGKSLADCKAELSQIRDVYDDLAHIANMSLENIVTENRNLLVFPKKFSKEEGINKNFIFSLQGSLATPEKIKLTTYNIMGFLGVGNTQIKIKSRFHTGNEDFLLYYLLQKVYSLNLFDLRYSSGTGFFDFLLFLFPQFLNKALSQGVFRTYKTFKRNDANIKGPVDISRHIKENIPFRGRIAYTSREFTTDNYMTELVRHTIEFIKLQKIGKIILCNNEVIRRNIDLIISATPSYNKRQRAFLIQQNIKPFNHPYFTAYRDLQGLCLAILNHKKLQYGENSNKIYGILFDGAWLWEECLRSLLKEAGFIHAQNKLRSNGINVWSHFKLYPDYYRGKQESKNAVNEIPETNFILDAKYKQLDHISIKSDDARQIVTYMHILPSKYAGFVYPSNKDIQEPKKEYSVFGLGGKVFVYGVKIPKYAKDYKDFYNKMEESLQNLKNEIPNSK